MLALLQRVNYARIVVEGECIADMQQGILAQLKCSTKF